MATQTLYYLNHSGFLLETEQRLFIFDFYTDPAQLLSRYENCGKAANFFVSHRHSDHWNPDIFDFRNTVPSYYFLDRALAVEAQRLAAAAPQARVFLLEEGSLLKADALGESGLDFLICGASTDEGLSFCFATEGEAYFYAGDLNNWDWSDEEGPRVERRYREILAHLRAQLEGERSATFNVAFVPVDRRLGAKATSGAHIFLEYFAARNLVPMHLNGGLELPERLAAELRAGGRHLATEVLSLTVPGQSLTLRGA